MSNPAVFRTGRLQRPAEQLCRWTARMIYQGHER